MKKIILYSFMAFGAGLAACNGNSSETSTTDSTATAVTPGGATTSYVDLKTGEPVTKDEASGKYVDQSGAPVQFYVDANTNDTFEGATGENVNNYLVHSNDGSWTVDEARLHPNDTDNGTITATDADVNGSGQAGDTKTQMDAKEIKIKGDNGKVKVKKDEVKVK